MVYDLEAEQQIFGSDLIKESYFAVIKERLQTYVAEKFPSAEGTAFITYHEVFKPEDYQKFYMTEDSLVFWFEENTLLPDGQKPFAYTVSLEEAKAFFHYNLDGTKSGIAIRELDPDKPMLAFTFDDGPAYKDDVDLKLIELFAQYDGRATFFFVGNRMTGTSTKNVVKQVYEAGFEVGSHTYTHTVNFGTTAGEADQPDMWKEYNKTNMQIASITGHAPDYVRLPGGAVGKLARELPSPFVNWNNDSLDYKYKNDSNGGQKIADQMMAKRYKDGDIILFHSIYQTSYESMVILLEYLDEKGYQFVTLSELFYYKGIKLQDGVIHYDGKGDTDIN